MKESESSQAMFCIFQIIIDEPHSLCKLHSNYDLIGKILKTLSTPWRLGNDFTRV